MHLQGSAVPVIIKKSFVPIFCWHQKIKIQGRKEQDPDQVQIQIRIRNLVYESQDPDPSACQNANGSETLYVGLVDSTSQPEQSWEFPTP